MFEVGVEPLVWIEFRAVPQGLPLVVAGQVKDLDVSLVPLA
jgi:hypothetical protein